MIGPDAVAASAAVRSPKTAELVAGTLRRMVVDGQLKDGDFLPNEAELMAHFSVSRPTVRAGLRELCMAQILVVQRGRNGGYRCRENGEYDERRRAGSHTGSYR